MNLGITALVESRVCKSGYYGGLFAETRSECEGECQKATIALRAARWPPK